ncbi:hypothetical protein HJTV-2_gp139 [Haloarcula virus HJTV-2]|uniref:Uncharacterized protein n=1 Tax=Haloarcula virus HJTV-2 TaxID=2877986 RepID=A0AAE9BXE4_9CAUD|nr:hypothetical protein M1M33_gp008 [Haloarcula virus HJTV-2]UBF21619.1 hypothetical protein HRTV-24_gp133 [Halorubrum virus HRTV-24]UBF21888.1 hypothetical protein HSTV-3_gp128 [Halorubrum virus HSTV-3]UBF22018.1 hypothetical protein HJTV-3_gp129 [Haloarcula virus HJTV-3]UBF22147.1 hypothetical protein HRTV-15_gp128 [Halorubrum virus HRTV-15]UBF21759.1 hypothetical protein HJTV-2_gp139 [Haloarcula virus HJTV-2]
MLSTVVGFQLPRPLSGPGRSGFGPSLRTGASYPVPSVRAVPTTYLRAGRSGPGFAYSTGNPVAHLWRFGANPSRSDSQEPFRAVSPHVPTPVRPFRTGSVPPYWVRAMCL